jgi:phage tail sheath gpL-like
MPVTTAYSSTRVARGVAIKGTHTKLGTIGTRYRPARIAVLAQGNADASYESTKRRIYNEYDVADVEGYGSPAHLIARSLFPEYGGGVGDIPVYMYPLEAQPTSGAQSAGSITPSIPVAITKTQTHYVTVNNIQSLYFTTVIGDTVATIIDSMVAAINGVAHMPLTATDDTTVCTTEVKWEGLTGDNVYVAVESPIDSEVSFAVVQPTNGADIPDITAALAQVGNAWDTHIINAACDYTGTGSETTLDEYAAFGEGRRDSEVHKPCCVFTGCNEATLATVTAVTDARKTDRTNVILANPGSHDLPCVIAAEAVSQIAQMDNENPAHDYCLRPTNLTPGLDSAIWTSAQRDTAVKAGCSTMEVRDGVVYLSDTVTCYHPTGEEPPGYRYVVDYAKRCVAINELDLEFGSSKWAGKPLIPDNQESNNPEARKPKHAVAALYRIIDNLSLDAIAADPDYCKENSGASIGTSNPKRLDVKLVMKLSGNTNVISIDYVTGFNYGS